MEGLILLCEEVVTYSDIGNFMAMLMVLSGYDVN